MSNSPPQKAHRLWELFSFYTKGKKRILFIGVIAGTLAALAESVAVFLFFPLLSENSDFLTKHKSGLIGMLLDGLNAFAELMPFSLKYSALLLVGLCFCSRGLFRWLEVKAKVKFVANRIYELRKVLRQAFASLSFQTFSSKKKGELAATLGSDFDQTRATSDLFFNFLSMFGSALVYLLAAAASNPTLTTFSLILCIAAGILLKILAQKGSLAARTLMNRATDYNSLILKAIDSYKYLRATNRYSKVDSTLELRDQQMLEQHRIRGKIEALLQASQQPLTALILVFTITFDSKVLGNPTSKSLITLVLIYRFINTAMNAINAVQVFASQLPILERVMKNMQIYKAEPEKVEDFSGSNEINSIDLQNIRFEVNNRVILRDINLKIQKKKIIGIIGHSGAGKTTLFDILTGIQEASDGKIFINNTERKACHLRKAREKFGMVTQDPVLFNASVTENITLEFNNKKAEDFGEQEKIISALRLSRAWSFVKDYPNLLEAKVGESENPLSGGQKQMLAIARELYLGSEILFLDEASSALDVDSEDNLLRTISRLKEKLGIVIISHRHRLLRSCDEILVLSRGTIVRKLADWEISKMSEDDWIGLVKAESETSVGNRRIYLSPELDFQANLFMPNSPTSELKVLNISRKGMALQQPKFGHSFMPGQIINGEFKSSLKTFGFEAKLIHTKMNTLGFELTSGTEGLVAVFEHLLQKEEPES